MSANLIQALIEAGTPAALIARVANELATANAKAEILESRRRNERERKARSREVTGQDVTGRDNADTPSLDKESFPQTPFKEIKPNPVCETRARGTRISEGWTPTKALPANVRTLTDQWPPGRYERELDGFRDYWSSRQRNAAMLDWDKGWWNRIRDQHDKVMRESRNGRQQFNGRQSASGMGRTVDALQDFVREAEARQRG